jgi:hypothetical protein
MPIRTKFPVFMTAIELGVSVTGSFISRYEFRLGGNLLKGAWAYVDDEDSTGLLMQRYFPMVME